MKQPLNRQWVFKPENRQAYLMTNQPENPVDLPHDFSIGMKRDPKARTLNSCGFFPGDIADYEKTLYVPNEWKDKRVFLLFEGVYMNTVVLFNQQIVARHPYGYTSFICELTEYLLVNEDNHIRVTVNNDANPNSRWYSGSGIYRPVWLIIKEKICIENWGVFAYTEHLNNQNAALRIQTKLANTSHKPAEVVLRSRLVKDGQTVTEAETCITLQEGEQTELAQRLIAANPQLWSSETPHLYALHSSLYEDGTLIDSEVTAIGIRTISFNANEGFRLNGEPMKLKGGCVHHDCGILGAAAHDRAEERKVRLLKENGFNAVRCAHNPPSVSFLDACDRLGILVIDEAFDAWADAKMTADYALYFNEWWQRDMASMVLRDRNHPSVIMWSTGNEIKERDGRSKGYETAACLAAYVRQLDPTRAVTNALCGIAEPGKSGGLPASVCPDTDDVWDTLTQKFARPLDVVGYNYAYDRYEKDGQRHPNRVICGTETFAKDAFETWEATERFPYVIGDFVWTALDYLGEAGIGRLTYREEASFCGDYPWHQAYCGDIDICGFKRPQSYYRDCVWGRARAPYIAVHKPEHYGKEAFMKAWGWPDVVSSWSWNGFKGKPVLADVYCAENEVDLFLNEQSLGRKPCGKAARYLASYTLTYAPGTLKAVGYVGGRAHSETTLATVKAPASLRLTAEENLLNPTFGELAFVKAEVVDEDGHPVPYATNELFFTVYGPGSMLALGNGDPISEEPYVGNKRSAHQGLAMAVIRSNGEAGTITLTACAEGLAPAQAVITVGA